MAEFGSTVSFDTICLWHPRQCQCICHTCQRKCQCPTAYRSTRCVCDANSWNETLACLRTTDVGIIIIKHHKHWCSSSGSDRAWQKWRCLEGRRIGHTIVGYVVISWRYSACSHWISTCHRYGNGRRRCIPDK
jgi:hypothetical protein